MRKDALYLPDPKLYRFIFEHAADAIVVLDDDGQVLLMNRAAREMPGIDLARMFVWSPARDHELVAFRAQLRVGAFAERELRVADEHGASRWLALQGRVQGGHYVVVVRDVTAGRLREEEIRHLRRLEAVGVMTASVVHDFNNVLTAITCSSALLPAALADAERASQLARDIDVAAQHAAELTRRVHSLLTRQPSRPQRVSSSDVVAEMRPLLERLVGSAVSLELDVDAEAGDVVLERERLEHALLNLAANARDAMPRGGRLVIATRRVAFGGDDVLSGDESYVALSVSDTGVGMSREVREHIFERFFTTKGTAGGAGLGLASVRSFVAESRGCISVQSAPGEGTTVVVYLPVAAPRGLVTIPCPESEEARGGTEAIVVIEPDDRVRRAMRLALVEVGYRVLDAPTGETALRQVEHSPWSIDLVIADVGTPGMGGSAAAERLRDSGHRARLLLASGLVESALVAYGVASEPLLRKVFSPPQLVRKVREVLDAEPVEPGTRQPCCAAR